MKGLVLKVKCVNLVRSLYVRRYSELDYACRNTAKKGCIAQVGN